MNKIRNLILLFFLALSLNACFGGPDKVPTIPKPVTWLNRPPQFELPKFNGKLMVFAFFTEDCSGCARIQPTFERLMRRYGAQIQILGVYTPLPEQKNTLPEIKQFLKEHRVLYPIIVDHNAKILRMFHITSWPTLVIANTDARIVQRINGTNNIINHLGAALHKASKQE